tara:strand:+ start:680 stop:841 length:162 start_codon:yes stop_codon:yes gene_type:complete
MAIFTFSSKDKRPEDAKLIKNIKEHCYKKNQNFSGLVINLLRKYDEEVIKDGR